MTPPQSPDRRRRNTTIFAAFWLAWIGASGCARSVGGGAAPWTYYTTAGDGQGDGGIGDASAPDGSTDSDPDAKTAVADGGDTTAVPDVPIGDAHDAVTGDSGLVDGAATDGVLPDAPDSSPTGCKTAYDCADSDPCTEDVCNATLGTCSNPKLAGCGDVTAACGPAAPCAKGVCDPSSNACVACIKGFDCGPGKMCKANACFPATPCKSDVGCKGANQVCALQEGVCADCNLDLDCGPGQACVLHSCIPAAKCASSKECPKVCDTKAGVCVECNTSADCAVPYYCGAGKICRPKLCTGPTCAGGSLYVCRADGSGYDLQSTCDDGEACTDDGCTTGVGCTHTSNAAACDDGNACTNSDVCASGKCKGKGFSCDDGNECTSDSCDTTKGCNNKANSKSCSDGTPCTVGDVCSSGGCKPGAALVCNDGKACTTDSCNASTGCVFTAAAGPCSDGDFCTSNDACQNEVCKGTATTCDDGNACTKDGCQSGNGCTHEPVTGPCDDGTVCVMQEACVGGKCVGKPVTCDDGNPCTDDSCDKAKGCQHGNNTVVCSDGDACTTGETCKDGTCKGNAKPVPCDDGQACTVDGCDKAKGCTHDAAASEGQACAQVPDGTCKLGICLPPCPAGSTLVVIDVDGAMKNGCAALGPAWGQRPVTPVDVYKVVVVDGQKVVEDSQTKLMWQQADVVFGKEWPVAQKYCNALTLAGYKDWRLPSVHELASLLDYAKPPYQSTGAMIDPVAFPGTEAMAYATLTPTYSHHWAVHFAGGPVEVYDTVSAKVRCVRGAPPAATAVRFVFQNAGKKVVLDQWTKLQWQRDVAAAMQTKSDAGNYCDLLDLDGKGWRLPHIRELHGLVDYGKAYPAIDESMLPTPADGLWSASAAPPKSFDAWYVGFQKGTTPVMNSTNAKYVRCVRGK